jgi:hypothetical protein
MAFAMALRGTTALASGVAPAGPLRDRQAEKRRALTQATKKAAEALKAPCKYAMTPWTRGTASDGYKELVSSTPLPIVLKAACDVVVTDSQRQRRLAAASRWNKVQKAAALAAGLNAPLPLTEFQEQAAVAAVRHPRRNELDHVASSYRAYETPELLSFVYKIRSKELKITEMKKLYREGKIRVSPTSVGNVLYPKDKADAKIAALEMKGLPIMGAPRKVRPSSYLLHALQL